MKNCISIEEVQNINQKIIYFYTPEMLYHDKFIKMMELIEKDFKIKCFSLNARGDDTLLKRFDFMSVPCLILFKDGKKYKKIEGMISYKDLKKYFKLEQD